MLSAIRTLPRRETVARSVAATVSLLVCAGCSACAPGATPPPSPAAIGILSIVVPNVVGLRADDARAKVISSGLRMTWSQPTDPPADWLVVSQQPAGGGIGSPASVVRLDVAARPVGSEGPTAGELVTPLGLTFEVAEAICGAQGRNTSPDGWEATFAVADARREGPSLVLHAIVALGRPDGSTELRAVECTVAGSDITPALEFFWVH